MKINDNLPKFLSDQHLSYSTVIESINNNTRASYFLEAPGGIEKIFLMKHLLVKVHHKSKIVSATATFGIAATLLPGCQTTHLTSKLLLDLYIKEDSV